MAVGPPRGRFRDGEPSCDIFLDFPSLTVLFQRGKWGCGLVYPTIFGRELARQSVHDRQGALCDVFASVSSGFYPEGFADGDGDCRAAEVFEVVKDAPRCSQIMP